MLKHRKTEHEQPEEGKEATPKTKEKSAMAKRKASNSKKERRPIDMSEAANLEGTEDFARRYKVIKTKLSHILRENEVLNEEYLEATKKLKRLRTERRVLLDVLVAAETGSQEKEPTKTEEVAAAPVAEEPEPKPKSPAQDVQEEEADDEEEEVDELMDEDE